jgi:hypothetical protein
MVGKRDVPATTSLLPIHTLTAKCGMTDYDVCFVARTRIELVSHP